MTPTRASVGAKNVIFIPPLQHRHIPDHNSHSNSHQNNVLIESLNESSLKIIKPNSEVQSPKSQSQDQKDYNHINKLNLIKDKIPVLGLYIVERRSSFYLIIMPTLCRKNSSKKNHWRKHLLSNKALLGCSYLSVKTFMVVSKWREGRGSRARSFFLKIQSPQNMTTLSFKSIITFLFGLKIQNNFS